MLIMENLNRIHPVMQNRLYAMYSRLYDKKLPVRLIVFGSTITDFMHLKSDLDIAYVTPPEYRTEVYSTLVEGFFENEYSPIQNMDCFYLPKLPECKLRNEILSKGVVLYDSLGGDVNL